MMIDIIPANDQIRNALETAEIQTFQRGGMNIDKLTQKQRIIEIASNFELFHDHENLAYATISRNGHYETFNMEHSSFKRLLLSCYFEETGDAPSNQALSEALAVLTANALYHGKQYSVAMRLIAHEGNIYIDLGRPDWQFLCISKDGWSLVNTDKVKFIRNRTMKPLPVPKTGGVLEDFQKFVNVKDKHDFQLLVAWMLAALRPESIYPILIVQGEQGTGKTFLSKLVRSLIDPNTSPVRSMPKDERDLIVSATNNLLLVYDNLSGLHHSMSDALCRLSTGGGLGGRKLYSDGEEFVMEAKRPQLVNGIDEIAVRPDLNERAIILNLPVIPDHERKSMESLEREFYEAQPYLLGALYDALSICLKNLSTTKLLQKPRMADFALWASAAEEYLGWGKGGFLSAYNKNRDEAIETTAETNGLVHLLEILTESNQTYQGTMAELLITLKNIDSTQGDINYLPWIKHANQLSRELRRISPVLRKKGIEYDQKKTEKGKMVIIRKTIEKTASIS